MSAHLRDNIKHIVDSLNVNGTMIITKDLYIGVDHPVEATLIFSNFMSSKDLINRDILTPLMFYFKEDVPEDDPYGYLIKKALPYCIGYKEDNEDYILRDIYRGRSALIIGDRKDAIVFDTGLVPDKYITTPELTPSTINPKLDFLASLLGNLALIKRHLRDSKLAQIDFVVGKMSRSDISIIYLEGVTNTSLVQNVKKKIDSLDINYIMSLGELAQYIEEKPEYIFPQNYLIDSPQIAAEKLTIGKLMILMEGCPYALCIPGIFADFIQNNDDYTLRIMSANFIRLIRFASIIIMLLVPSSYIAIIKFSSVLLSSDFIEPLAIARKGIALSPFMEIFVMECIGEILREGGIRLQSKVAQTVSVIGAIILGYAALDSHIVSNTALFVVGLSICSSFVISGNEHSSSLRILKFPTMVLANSLGIIGIAVSLYFIIVSICDLEIFGIEFLSMNKKDLLQDSIFRRHIWNINNKSQRYKTGE